jgi:copper chaperone CopZ
MRTDIPSSDFTVAGMSCGYCRAAITEAVGRLPGIEAVAVDLDSKRVTVRGERLDDAAVRSAIADAGYHVEP